MPDSAEAPETDQLKPITSIKGFNADWTCRGYQFQLGASYKHEGIVEACGSGFHAIEGYPLEVFDYYPPGGSRFAEVEQSGALSRHGGDSKVASAEITIKAELHVPELVDRAFKWVFAQCKPANAKHAEGDQSAASSTGDRSAASSTGYRSAASSTGYQSAAMASGRWGRAMAEKNGCALFLVYRDDDWNIVHAWAGVTGQNGVRAGVWYQLGTDGEPVEVRS